MAKFTQRQLLEAALLRHGCQPVGPSFAGNWQAWSTGDLLPTPTCWFYVGPQGFRFGPKRASSRDYPKLRARLMAEMPF
jgi:hypothetical protein